MTDEKTPVIKCKTEEVIREDGRVDVIIKVPKLKVMQLLKEKKKNG